MTGSISSSSLRSSQKPALLGVLGVFIALATALGGCQGTPEQPTASPSAAATTVASPEAKGASPEAKGASPAAPTGTASLVAVVDRTQAAVKKGDFAQAKKEFDGFEDAWKPIEDGIKEKTPKAYKDIEDSADAVKAALGNSQPKAAQLSQEFAKLSQAIAATEAAPKK